MSNDDFLCNKKNSVCTLAKECVLCTKMLTFLFILHHLCLCANSYRRLLNISYKDHVTNEEVRRKIQAAIGEYDELLTLVKKRKLRWFGHVSRSSDLAKTILQGTVKGKRKRGRQKKRWEDNIKEWTGMDFASSTRAAENRSRWKGILANSSVVPRRPSKVMG